MYKIQYGTKELEFKSEFRNRKTISLSVEPPNDILVVAHSRTSKDIRGN